MSLTAEKLYELLPAIYRIRDHEQGEPLKALIAVLAEQAGVLEEDILRLYEDWFIETCHEWVVPYIGDLLGVRGMHPISTESGVSQRAYVANTIRYRRRKGTATVLEQLAFDTTGWRARAVEFFELLGTTQYYNHIRLHNVRTPDLRLTNELELLDTAFDRIAHTVDVRHIDDNRGWHNIPNIGLFLWRIQSYFVACVTARQVTEPSDGRYRFNPLGFDAPVFNRPQTETEITHLAEEVNVPGLLRRRPLYDELEARRQALVDGRTPEYVYFDDRPETKSPPVFEVFLNGSSSPISLDEIMICNLENWNLPSKTKTYRRLKDDGSYEEVERSIRVAVDPVLGRLTFSDAGAINEVHVSYAYGFSGDVGGGPYDRRASVGPLLERKVDWHVGVGKNVAPKPGEIYASINETIEEWNKQPAGSVGIIAILDNSTYKENFSVIKIPTGSQLLIVAAKWPEEELPGALPGEKQRLSGRLEPKELRPHVQGNLKVKGTASTDNPAPGGLILDGFLVEGRVSVHSGNLGSLRIAHCTLVPPKSVLQVTTGNERLQIDLVQSICGPILLDAEISKLCLEGSIIDNADGPKKAIGAVKTPLELQKSTIFGEVQGLSIEASNCIFTEVVDVVRRQIGCIRFSYVPRGSKTPRCFRCQPDLELSRQISEADWLVPGFTSSEYGHYGYAQLSRTCPLQIRTGAEDGSEMGVFNILQQPQREANLRTALDEYLKFGLEAGILYVT